MGRDSSAIFTLKVEGAMQILHYRQVPERYPDLPDGGGEPPKPGIHDGGKHHEHEVECRQRFHP